MINWRVRLRNPVFWVQIAVAILAPAMAYFGMSWDSLTSWDALSELILGAANNPVILASIAVSVFNAANDPTTKGLLDSYDALKYEVPKERVK